MVEYDPMTNEEVVASENDAAAEQTDKPVEDDEDHWLFRQFQYMPINWWI